MKKVVSLAAICLMFVGFLTSCEADTALEETDALYQVDLHAGEDDAHETGRDGK